MQQQYYPVSELADRTARAPVPAAPPPAADAVPAEPVTP